MEPGLILATIRAGFDFGIELLKWVQTEEGRAFSKQNMQDRAAWDKFWKDAGTGIQGLFGGRLFKLPGQGAQAGLMRRPKPKRKAA